MDPVLLAEINTRLRQRGLPQTPLYRHAEQQRMLEEMRRQRRAQVQGQVERSREFRDATSELTPAERRRAGPAWSPGESGARLLARPLDCSLAVSEAKSPQVLSQN